MIRVFTVFGLFVMSLCAAELCGQIARIDAVRGIVKVTATDGAQRNAKVGDVLDEGFIISTHRNGWVRISFFKGGTLELEEYSQVQLMVSESVLEWMPIEGVESYVQSDDFGFIIRLIDGRISVDAGLYALRVTSDMGSVAIYDGLSHISFIKAGGSLSRWLDVASDRGYVMLYSNVDSFQIGDESTYSRQRFITSAPLKSYRVQPGRAILIQPMSEGDEDEWFPVFIPFENTEVDTNPNAA